MDAPSEALRAQIMAFDDGEAGARQALLLIDHALAEANLSVIGEPYATLGVVESWTGLMSYVVANTYAPHSKMRFAGWTKEVPELLRRMADKLRGALTSISRAIGASGFSIGVSFPWGVSVALNWG